MKIDSQRWDVMDDYIFYERDYEGRLEVARSEDDASYTFATVVPGGQSSFVILERDEVEALVSVLSELLAPAPTA